MRELSALKRQSDLIRRIGIELEGGWICTCPVRNKDASIGVQFNPDTGFLHAIGAQGNNSVANSANTVQGDPQFGIKITPEIGKLLAAKDKFKPCTCIPANVKGDGSVSTGARTQGEIVSPPGGQDLATWPEWVETKYPHLVNVTCGLHVHFSFQSMNTMLNMMTPELELHVVNDLARWGQAFKVPFTHPFWNRLCGGASYCQRGITDKIIDDQFHRDASRYFVTNFCYKKHKTMEIRVLPMFKEARTAIRAINALIKSVESFAAQRSTIVVESESVAHVRDFEKTHDKLSIIAQDGWDLDHNYGQLTGVPVNDRYLGYMMPVDSYETSYWQMGAFRSREIMNHYNPEYWNAESVNPSRVVE